MPLIHHQPTFHFEARLGAYQNQVDTVLQELTEHRIIERIWEHDATVWPPASTAMSNPLGWLQTAKQGLDSWRCIVRRTVWCAVAKAVRRLGRRSVCS